MNLSSEKCPEVFLSYSVGEDEGDAQWLLVDAKTNKTLARFTQPDLVSAFEAGYKYARSAS